MQLLKAAFAIQLILLVSCNSKTASSLLDSSDLDSPKARIDMLSQHIKLRSSIKDCDFELFNVNGFGNDRSVPGASSSDYKFGIILNKEDLSKWTSGLSDTTFQHYDFSWLLKIIQKRPGNWPLHSKPRFFVNTGENLTTVVYGAEGILFERIINN